MEDVTTVLWISRIVNIGIIIALFYGLFIGFKKIREEPFSYRVNLLGGLLIISILQIPWLWDLRVSTSFAELFIYVGGIVLGALTVFLALTNQQKWARLFLFLASACTVLEFLFIFSVQ